MLEIPESVDELESYLAWERSQGGWEFQRTEMRVSSCGRLLDCGHRIDRTEPYRYFVGKVRGLEGLIQRRDCDVCMRVDNSY